MIKTISAIAIIMIICFAAITAAASYEPWMSDAYDPEVDLMYHHEWTLRQIDCALERCVRYSFCIYNLYTYPQIG